MPEEGVELVQRQGMPEITDSYQKVGNAKSHTKALKFTGKDALHFTDGICYSKLSPGPALCRFIFELLGKMELQISINTTSLQLS